MAFLGKTIYVLVILICLAGCTLHFKATDVELDAERQRVQVNKTYELEKIDFFDGEVSH